jgi:hypothetical protein
MGTLACAALAGCSGQPEETANLAGRLGRDARLAPPDDRLLEPPPRFSPSERRTQVELLQGHLNEVTEKEVQVL